MRRADRKLVRGLQGRRKQAYVETIERNHETLYRFLMRLAGDASLAEDLTQESFAAAWRDIDRFEGRSSLSTWLHRVALNVWRQHRRHSRPRAVSWDEADVPDPGPLPFDCVSGQQLQQAAERCADGLPDPYREVVILRVYQGLKHREIAEVLGIALGTAQYRVHIGLRKLRVALREEMGEHEVVTTTEIGESERA